MARIGMNPSRTKTSDYRPARVTVAVLVHLPYLAGYYEHRLMVLKTSLWSLKAHTSVAHDLMVFDNGSGSEAASFLRQLQDQGGLTILVRSETNLGKAGALQILFNAAPGELIAYADDDFFYYPGWLEAQLAVMEAYPNVGMVSGYTVPSFFTPDRTASNARFAREVPGVTVERVDPFPELWITEWVESTGRDPALAREDERRFSPVRYEYRGVRALGAANHDQFLCRKATILQALPKEWSGQLMGQMIELDRAVDRAGYLRLATAERTTQHIGNVVSSAMAARLPRELDLSGLVAGVGARGRRSTLARFRKKVLWWGPIRWFLLGIYSRLFRWINPP